MTEAETKTKPRKRSAGGKKKTSNAVSPTSKALVIANSETECLTQHARQDLIEKAAYRRAEARNFEGERALEDWLEAEAEINEKFPVNTDQV
tara:strand:- start:264 stop:539 length:276 start_codon:yes stop_codon:yes gene_type:complete